MDFKQNSMKILLADDHRIVRQGLKKIIEEFFVHAEIYEVDNGYDLFEKAVTDDWSFIISDISMPKFSIELVQKIVSVKPKNKILILSMHGPEQYALRCIKAGASGYLVKDCAAEELIIAIRQILAGKKYITPDVAEILVASFERHTSDEPLHTLLTNKELAVFEGIAQGLSMKKIAEKLDVSINTISSYRARILVKMGLKSNAEMIKYAIENNVLT